MFWAGNFYKDIKEKKKKVEEQKLMACRKSLEIPSMKRKYTHKGFAYGATAGHAPNITKNLKIKQTKAMKEEKKEK
jgi:hypothetical protein